MDKNLELIASARGLHDLLWHNIGEKNADWPIHLTMDEDVAVEVCNALNRLQNALKSIDPGYCKK